MGYVIAAMSVLAAVHAACVWRVIQAARVVPRLEERLARLAHSIDLLTNTTEGCFNTVAAQLSDRPPLALGTGSDTRQRRVTGAARRGRSVQQIAVQEELSESEVALRLSLGGSSSKKRRSGHATLRS
jgi:DNA-binding NarL/FixJ family response regulator